MLPALIPYPLSNPLAAMLTYPLAPPSLDIYWTKELASIMEGKSNFLCEGTFKGVLLDYNEVRFRYGGNWGSCTKACLFWMSERFSEDWGSLLSDSIGYVFWLVSETWRFTLGLIITLPFVAPAPAPPSEAGWISLIIAFGFSDGYWFSKSWPLASLLKREVYLDEARR